MAGSSSTTSRGFRHLLPRLLSNNLSPRCSVYIFQNMFNAFSDSEKTYFLHGVEADFRYDGRTRTEYRPMELETDLVPHASGSARLRLANTDLLVGVKAEIDKPSPTTPNKGKIEFFVDCSANATPDFEGRGGEDLANELSGALTKAYASEFALDKTALCILPSYQCWKIYVDILILECGGNLFDAAGLGVKAALQTARIPRVVAALLDGDNPELTLSDDPEDCFTLSVKRAPLLVTLVKIGEHCVVDPGIEEEVVGGGGILLAYGDDRITTVLKIGEGSLHPNTFKELLKMGVSAGKSLQTALDSALEREKALGDDREKAGFLK